MGIARGGDKRSMDIVVCDSLGDRREERRFTIAPSFVPPLYASSICSLSAVFLSVLIKRTLWKSAGVTAGTWGLFALELLGVAAGSSDTISVDLGIDSGSDSSISTSL